jgi:hypothetical protein
MQFVIAHASALSPAATQALSGLALPNLERLLARLSPVAEDLGDELSLSAPHERALAQAWGWPVADGLLPLATLSARADGLAAEGEGWGLISPTHWHLGTEQVSLANPAELDLDEATARALFDVLRPCSKRTAGACTGARPPAGMCSTRSWPACPPRRWTG